MSKNNFIKMIYLEYIWLDGNKTQGLRSKTKIISKNPNKFNFKEVKESLLSNESHELVPDWSFDGSSTCQASTDKSELILKPVNIFKDPFIKNKEGDDYLVMCEVFNTDGTPHHTNKRSGLRDVMKYDQDMWWGYEQEVFVYSKLTNQPLGWPNEGYPAPQGQYYCGVGGNAAGRDFMEYHADLCLSAGLNITGLNLEVSLGQIEYQLFSKHTLDGADQLWIARYIMERLAEKYDYSINLHPKPFRDVGLNGSGMHINFSTKNLRENISDKKKIAFELCEKLSKRCKEHLDVYGEDNQYRLTGHNETCSIDEFRYGIGDRTASVRIPSSINDGKTAGYVEDRRPASNCNPYEATNVMIKTICM